MLFRSTTTQYLSLLALPLLLVVALTVSLTSGTIHISLIDILTNTLSPLQETVLFHLRIPRVLLAIGVGGGLGLAGLFVQTLFHNPLVEPYTLGISGGASLAVALATVFGLSSHTFGLAAFAGSALVTSLLWIIAAHNRGKTDTLLLFGVMISFISGSFLVLIFSLVSSEQLQQIIFWTMGSLEPKAQWDGLPLISLSLAMATVATLFGRELNLLSIGEEQSHVTGVNTTALRLLLLLGATILTALAVSLVGVIGFIGLLVPHTARALWGGDNRILVGASFVGGAIFLLITDTIARTVVEPTIIPVGAITGILGGGLFIFLLIHKRGEN